jgi:sialidase-1
MTYGWRFPGFGIRAVISNDGGETWATDETIIVRDDLPNKNLGYPATVTCPDGSLYTVYYGEDADGSTVIMGTRWRLP